MCVATCEFAFACVYSDFSLEAVIWTRAAGADAEVALEAGFWVTTIQYWRELNQAITFGLIWF